MSRDRRRVAARVVAGAAAVLWGFFWFGLIDLLPYGRQEEWQDSPDGWPQSPTYSHWDPAEAFARYAEQA